MRERKNVAKEESTKPLPYPLTPSKKAKESYIAKFLEIFKKLEIKIPFGDALQQIPLYAKFMKELLTKKRKNNEVRGNCSAIIQNVLPLKRKDPGSFTIPCTIHDLSIRKALIDEGASIKLMPLSMLKKIVTLEMKPIRMSLHLVNQSITYPLGVMEDVLVKVRELTFPVDFVIMDIEEDR